MEPKLTRFLLTLLLGWIGSIVINHTAFKPEGYKCRTLSYFFLGFLTCGIYQIVAAIMNFKFDPEKERNIGYFKEEQPQQ